MKEMFDCKTDECILSLNTLMWLTTVSFKIDWQMIPAHCINCSKIHG